MVLFKHPYLYMNINDGFAKFHFRFTCPFILSTLAPVLARISFRITYFSALFLALTYHAFIRFYAIDDIIINSARIESGDSELDGWRPIAGHGADQFSLLLR